MVEIKFPKKYKLNQYPKTHRVIAVIGDGPHGLSVVRNLGTHGLCVLTVCSSPNGRPR